MFPNNMTWWEAFLLTGQPWWQWSGWGFELFGPEHVCWLIICAALMTYIIRSYIRSDKESSKHRRIQLVVGIFPLCSLALTNILCISQGLYEPTRLPLYFCNLCELIVFIEVFHPNIFCEECAFALSIVSGASALIFPAWRQCPAWNIMSITGFLEHSCLVAFPLMKLMAKEIRPDMHRAWMPISLTLAYGLAIMPFNLSYGSNFGFVPDPMGTWPLEDIYQTVGNPVYTILVFICSGALILGEYVLVKRLDHKNTRRLSLSHR